MSAAKEDVVSVLGRGSFSSAYLRRDGRVLVKSVDDVKECMAVGHFPNSRLFPRIERIDYDGRRTHYLMPRYGRVTAPKRQLVVKDYELYKILREISGLSGYKALLRVFSGLRNRRARHALLDALNGLVNYGYDMAFEISPRNVGVTKAGRLVLLDCFFFKSQLDEQFQIRTVAVRGL